MIAANLANLLSVARLLCAVPIVLLVQSGAFHQAALVFVLAALSDGLDGLIAKRFDAATPLGAVLDPVADKVLMASLFLVLAYEAHLPAWIALIVIGRDLLMILGTLILRYLVGRFRVEPLLLGKASTFVQIVLGAAVLLQLSFWPWLQVLLPPLMLVTAVIVIASGVAYIQAAGRIWVLARVVR